MIPIFDMPAIDVLKTLQSALAEIQVGYKTEMVNEQISGDYVKEARAKGAYMATTVTIQTIEEIISDALLAKAEAEANKHVQDKDYLREMAKLVQAKLPDNFGFLLLAAPYGDSQGRLVYTSTMKREGAVNLVKEWMIKGTL